MSLPPALLQRLAQRGLVQQSKTKEPGLYIHGNTNN